LDIAVNEDAKIFTIPMIPKISKVTFPISSSYRYLVFQFRNLNKFFKINLKVIDGSSKLRNISISNSRSTVYIMHNECSIPLIVSSSSWQILKIDIVDILKKAFGVTLNVTTEISIEGVIKISKIYFEDLDYCDAQLPDFLRLVGSMVA